MAAFSLMVTPLSAWSATDAEVDELVITTQYLRQRQAEQEREIAALQRRIVELERRQTVSAIDMGLLRGRGTAGFTPLAQTDGGIAQPGIQAEGQASESGNPDTAATTQTGEEAGNGPATDAAAQSAGQTAVQPGTAAATQLVDPPASGPSGTVQGVALTSTQGIPLFDRKFSFEHGLVYTHWDKRSLILSGFLALDAILLGKINLQQIKTDQLQYDLTGRWNLSERLSTDLNLPLVYRRSNYISPGAGGSASALSDGANGTASVGDMNAGVYYQLSQPNPASIDWIGSIRVRAPTGRDPFGIKLLQNSDPNNNNLVIPTRQPTGNGVWSTTLGLTLLKTYDPIVLFGNLGYTYNFKRHFKDLSTAESAVTPGEVRLGNSWTVGAGFALAVNDKTSVSFSYAQLIQQTSKLRADGGPWVRQTGSDTNSATFNAGLTFQLSKNLSMVGTMSMGLTPDAPDFSVGIKFPYTF